MNRMHNSASNDRAKDFKGSLKMLLKRLNEHKAYVIIAIIFAALAAVLNVLGPNFLNDLMTMLFDQNGYEVSDVTKMGLIILCMYLVAGILGYLQGFLMSKVSVGVSKKLRT